MFIHILTRDVVLKFHINCTLEYEYTVGRQREKY